VQDYLTFGGFTTLEFPPDRRLGAAVASLLDAYSSTTDDVGPDFHERVVAFAGAKLIHRAMQLVAWRARGSSDADRHGALGLELLEHPDLAVALLAP
jgi:hypothetical protein